MSPSPAPNFLGIRPAAQIFAAEGGWFRARWHFSFDQYYDPENMGIGALRVFNHDTLVPGAVWPMHPHRDVEGITYVLKGEFEHADSLGNGGVLLPGGVQRMRLGSGAQHSERNHSQTQEMQFLQLWILPSRQGLPPDVRQHQYTEADRNNRLLQVIRGEGASEAGADAALPEPIDVAQEAAVYASRLDEGVEVGHTFAEGHGGYLYLIQGRANVNGAEMASGDAAYVRTAGALSLVAATTCELVLVDTVLV